MFNRLLEELPLRHILNLASKLNVDEDIVRVRSIEALPIPIRSITPSQTALMLERLGILANELLPFL